MLYILKSIFYTFFPKKCICCGNILQTDEKFMCQKCNDLYPYPDKIEYKEEFFAPLAPYMADICILGHYHILKQPVLKFKFNSNVFCGRLLTDMFCGKLKRQQWINDIDYIVPVPLHKKKLRKRGFNQSQVIARMIGKSLNIPIQADNLRRIKNTYDQHLSRGSQRYDNVKGAFALKDIALFKNKSILLVDDVITTCSTSVECCKVLKQCEGIKIYIGAIASDRKIL